MIKSIAVENFMSIENGLVEFDESNIICLCGYNDSGKSAFTEAIEILFYDSYAREQAAFIQDGKEYFKITMEFTDGVSICKTKYRTGNSVWELKQAGTMLYTNQLDGAVASVDKVPDAIEKYLGVIFDEYTQSLLNVRRNRDKLLLVGTTGGDNYKIFNSILKSDLLAETSKRLNADKNKLSTECNNKANSLQTIANEIDCMNCASEESLESLNTMLIEVAELSDRVTMLEEIERHLNTVKEYVDWGEIQPISVESFLLLDEIKRLYGIISEPIYEECTLVDTTRLNELAIIKAEMEKVKGIDIVPEIDVSVNTMLIERYNALNTLLAMGQDVSRAVSEVAEIEGDLAQTQNILQNYADKYNYKICHNCGTVVI